MDNNVFEQVTRNKIRFPSNKGMLTVEDLWDLPLSSKSERQDSLDSVAVAVNRKLKETDEISFVNTSGRSNASKELRLAFEAVKHIIDVRKAERDSMVEAEKRRQNNARIDEIIERKRLQDLENKSIDELEALKVS